MDNPSVEYCTNSGVKCLRFTFVNRLETTNAVIAIKKWQDFFAKHPNEKMTLIWNCLKMTGYDSNARSEWQNALKELKSQIGSIWLVTDSNFIKMGASVMSIFASYQISVVKNESEIKFN